MTKHGYSSKRIYRIWYAMIQRCHNEKRKDFERYGAKGIVVCEKWHDCLSFINDMETSYIKHAEKYGEKDTTIERINNEFGYNPQNCRWATRKEQIENRSVKYDCKPLERKKRNVVQSRYANRLYKGISPNNEVFKFTHITIFAKEHNLDRHNISKVCRGEKKTHKGWRFFQLMQPMPLEKPEQMSMFDFI